MANNMDPQQPVYGLQPPGLDGTHAPIKSIEEIAAFYNREIMNHNPDGPYAIAGYSFGGYIAFEMAKQLKLVGREVKLLAMFDTVLQVPANQLQLGKRICIKAMRQIYKLAFRTKLFFTHPVYNVQYLVSSYREKMKLLMRRTGFTKTDDTITRHLMEIAGELENAYKEYVAAPADITLDLFVANHRYYFVDDPVSFGWKGYTLKGLHIHTIPGDHKGIFDPPNDKILADILQQRLNEVMGL